MAKVKNEAAQEQKTQKQREKDAARLAAQEVKREKQLVILQKHVDVIEEKHAAKVAKLEAKKSGLDEIAASDIDHKIGALERKRLADINAAYDKYAPKKKVKTPLVDKIYYTAVYTIIILLLIIILYPVIYIISSSFSSPTAVVTGKVVLWPVDLSVEGYIEVFKNPDVWLGYRNTILYTVGGTLINVVMTLMCAYPLSRRTMPFKGFFTFLFTFTMIFNGGMIPTYIVMKHLGMINNPLVMILPGAITVQNLIISRTYMQSSIPGDLLEAAQIDGCSDIKYFFSCVLPLATSNIAVITLYYAVGHWNAYFNAFIYLTSREYFPLQVFLREVLLLSQVDTEATTETGGAVYGLSDVLKYALIVVATAPILAIYPFVQKFFVKGVMVGSLKG